MKCSLLWPVTVTVLALGPTAGAGPVQAVSLADPSSPVSVTGNGFSASPAVSSNGLWVVFVSQASNLTTNDFSGNPRGQWLNVFVRNLATGQTTLVSVTPDGSAAGNDSSYAPALSGDGRFVVFESRASNLVTNDNNGASDIFVRDLQTGVTRLVSVNNTGTGSGDGASTNPNVTPDGRYVVFESAADDLVADDTNGISDIFVRDLQGGATTLVSANAQPVYGGGGSDSPVITADGRWVAFASTATNLVAGATNFFGEIYVRDVANGVTYWASSNVAALVQSLAGNTQHPPPASSQPSLSSDGRYVAFGCDAFFSHPSLILRHDLLTGVTDLISTNGQSAGMVSGPALSPDGQRVAYAVVTTNALVDTLFVWDSNANANLLVSANTNGVPANGLSDTPAFTPDGRSVAFFSDASDLVTNALDGNSHIFVRDLSAGATQLIDVDRNGTARGQPFDLPSFSADGSVAVFSSLDDQLTTNDLNGAYDVFVRNLTNRATALVSARDSGLPTLTANGSSSLAAGATSAEGRFAVFTSEATNLVAGDLNGVEDVFVYDLLRGANLLVSVNTNGVSGNGASSLPAISADGRFVAFVSAATDLAATDTNSLPDVYLRDLQAGTTTLVSVNLSGMAAGVDSVRPAISANGRFVAFASSGTGIVTNSAPLNHYLFIRDLWTGTTTEVPPPSSPPGATLPPSPLSLIDPGGSVFFRVVANFYYFDPTAAATRFVGTGNLLPAASANGRFLAYQNLILTTNTVYVYDAVAGSNTVASYSRGATVGPHSGYQLAVSDDGRFVAFVCDFTNLVANDTNQAPDVFVADTRNPGQLILVSANLAGTGPGNAASDSPTMSRDGRFVAFRSFATNLVSERTDGQPNVFMRDLLAGTTVLLSGNRASSGSGDGRSSMPVISGDGATVFFNSDAPDLVAGDLNNSQDVFFWNNPATAGHAFPAIANGAATITWTTVTGHTYRLESENGLTDPIGWTAVGADETASGPTMSRSDPLNPTAPQRLYRVRLVQ